MYGQEINAYEKQESIATNHEQDLNNFCLH